MSTRTQIRFVDNGRITQVYKHSDGYPEGVLPLFAELRDLQRETGTFRDSSYTAANFILLTKMAGMRLTLDLAGNDYESAAPFKGITATEIVDPENWSDLGQPNFLLGSGVEDPDNGIHGDEEYLYEVDLPDYQPFDEAEPNDWIVRISGHRTFPSWDGPTEEAFDRVEWEFDGTLADALDKYA